MSDSSMSILEAFQNSSELAAVAKAVKEGQSEGLPIGEYQWRLQGGRWSGYEDKKTGKPIPAITLEFKTEVSYDDDRLRGRKVQEFLNLGNREDGSRSFSWNTIEKMYKKLFNEKFPAAEDLIPAAVQRLVDEGKSSLWKVARVASGDYINTRINDLVVE